MRVLLLSPGKLDFYGTRLYPNFYPRLGIRVLATLSPPDCEVDIVEYERVEKICVTGDVDLVGISILTPFAKQAYTIADAYKSLGVKVVLGGIHPTIMPNEAIAHADSVVVGEAESLWPGLIADAKRECLHKFYRAEELTQGDQICKARRLPTDEWFYKGAFHLEAGRGCKVGCDFCVVPLHFGKNYRRRPVDAVIQEAVEGLSNRKEAYLVFSENLLGNPQHTLELCRKIQKYSINFSAEGDLPHLDDSEYLKILKASGLRVIYVETKAYSKKTHPLIWKKYERAIEKITEIGIELAINFTVGYDDHDESIFDEIWELVNKWDIIQCYVQILVPWPGTPVFQKLKGEGRIITYNWSRYHNCESVYIPKQMTPEAMIERYYSLIKQVTAKCYSSS